VWTHWCSRRRKQRALELKAGMLGFSRAESMYWRSLHGLMRSAPASRSTWRSGSPTQADEWFPGWPRDVMRARFWRRCHLLNRILCCVCFRQIGEAVLRDVSADREGGYATTTRVVDDTHDPRRVVVRRKAKFKVAR
jgi:hypothetical protein